MHGTGYEYGIAKQETCKLTEGNGNIFRFRSHNNKLILGIRLNTY